MSGRAMAGRTRDTARVTARRVASNLQRVSSSVTHRDQLICLDLHEHRVLTTDQLFELHFASLQRTRARLRHLYDLGVVWRSRPRALLGSLPWHYTLDEIGALIVAEHLGIDHRMVSYRQDRTRALVDSPRLEHTRAANSFFTRLCRVARTTEGPVMIAEWRGEEWCSQRWHGHVRPDGYARIDLADRSLEFLFELDMGTERLSRLEAKMERYRIMAKAETAPDVVLFCFPTEGREANARPALGGTPMPVATATLERHLSEPFGPNWLSISADRRVPFWELGHWSAT